MFLGPLVSNGMFTGANALAEYNSIFNMQATGIPLDSTAGHWDESVFGTEVMTPLLDPDSCPLSRITVAALMDLGYTVNLAAADPFVPSSAALAAALAASSTEHGDTRAEVDASMATSTPADLSGEETHLAFAQASFALTMIEPDSNSEQQAPTSTEMPAAGGSSEKHQGSQQPLAGATAPDVASRQEHRYFRAGSDAPELSLDAELVDAAISAWDLDLALNS
jgi:hypothetical protein